VHTGEKTL